MRGNPCCAGQRIIARSLRRSILLWRAWRACTARRVSAETRRVVRERQPRRAFTREYRGRPTRAPRAPAAPGPMVPKNRRAYGTNSLRQEISLRDHAMGSGMMSRVNTDAGDMCTSAVQAAGPGAKR